MRFGRLVGTTLAALCTCVLSTTGQEPSRVFDFALTRAFLQNLRTGHTILPTYTMHVVAHSKLKGIGEDCEVHLAATLAPEGQVDPDAVVAEPPNLCVNTAPGGGSWLSLFDARVINKDCRVKGFPRIFTEHATTGGEHESNPNHVFEIHPALRLDCDGSAALDFTAFMGAPEGLRHILPSSAESCIAGRTLSVRFKNSQYEFLQKGGSGCGNFAIIEVSHLHEQWIRATGGGHSALARITADGNATHTMKLYTLEGTSADDWVTSVQAGHADTKRHIIHGILTYDYFAILKAVTKVDGSWLPASTLASWKLVDFPIAFIVYGETETIPWEDGGN
jgi:hypothetical protein